MSSDEKPHNVKMLGTAIYKGESRSVQQLLEAEGENAGKLASDSRIIDLALFKIGDAADDVGRAEFRYYPAVNRTTPPNYNVPEAQVRSHAREVLAQAVLSLGILCEYGAEPDLQAVVNLGHQFGSLKSTLSAMQQAGIKFAGKEVDLAKAVEAGKKAGKLVIFTSHNISDLESYGVTVKNKHAAQVDQAQPEKAANRAEPNSIAPQDIASRVPGNRTLH